MFSALGGYISLIDGDWSATEVRLAVDIGTLAIALASIAIRAPFTLQYAREMVDAETMKMPGFLRANYIITWAWTGAFVLMLIANLLMIYLPSLPFWVGLGIGVAARNCAVYFTKWYPAYRQMKYGAATAGALVSPSRSVIASEAKHSRAASTDWIASSQGLLAMTNSQGTRR
jgi:hypothetical protein